MLIETRSQRIKEKVADCLVSLGGEDRLDDLYRSAGILYDKTAMGVGNHVTDNLELHPIVWGIDQTGKDLSDILSTLWDEPDALNVTPVEYLPVVSRKSYFARPEGRSQYLSQLILDVFTELRMNSSSIGNTLDRGPGQG